MLIRRLPALESKVNACLKRMRTKFGKDKKVRDVLDELGKSYTRDKIHVKHFSNL